MRLLRNLFAHIDAYIAGVALAVTLYILAQEMLVRWLFNMSFTWTEDLSRVLLVVLVYFGASAVAGEDRHIRVGFILQALPEKPRKALLLAIDLACLAFCILVVWLGYHLVRDTAAIGLSFAHSGFGMPVWVAQSSVPIAFTIASVRIAARIFGISHGADGAIVAPEEG